MVWAPFAAHCWVAWATMSCITHTCQFSFANRTLITMATDLASAGPSHQDNQPPPRAYILCCREFVSNDGCGTSFLQNPKLFVDSNLFKPEKSFWVLCEGHFVLFWVFLSACVQWKYSIQHQMVGSWSTLCGRVSLGLSIAGADENQQPSRFKKEGSLPALVLTLILPGKW